MDKALSREYEDFVYIVSHDLQAPVRHVKEFTKLLVNSFREMDDDQHAYVGFIEGALNRLEKMHELLLEFSRISTHGGDFTAVESAEIVKEALRAVDREHAPIITVGELPSVYADAAQLRTIFAQLISNAIKFNDGDIKIDITAKESNHMIVFSVKDNGIGVDPKFRDDIFRMFRRLHVQDRYGGGTGAGLALTRKAVERHRGKIWVESKGGAGATFLFSIPKA